MKPPKSLSPVHRRISVFAVALVACLTSSASMPADEPTWAVGVATTGGFGGNGNRKPGIYVDSDLRIGVLKATLPPRASYCSSAFLDQADASAIEAFLLEMQRAIPNRAFLEVRSYCKDDLRVRVDVRGPQSQSRLFDYPISEECVGDGTVPTWLLSLVDRVRAYEDAVARCVSVEPATEGVAAPRR